MFASHKVSECMKRFRCAPVSFPTSSLYVHTEVLYSQNFSLLSILAYYPICHTYVVILNYNSYDIVYKELWHIKLFDVLSDGILTVCRCIENTLTVITISVYCVCSPDWLSHRQRWQGVGVGIGRGRRRPAIRGPGQKEQQEEGRYTKYMNSILLCAH